MFRTWFVAAAFAATCNARYAPGWKNAGVFDEDFKGVKYGEGLPMKLQLMKDKVADGAVCLDGTPAGFYFSPAANDVNKNDWQIYFEGGGWCYDDMDCWGRSNGGLGSSKGWGPTFAYGGIMSDSCDINPDFCNFNRIIIAYCDGNSFTGNRDEPLVVKGKPLYFRGRRIVDAVLETLMPMGLANVSRFMLTGSSAGGLAAYLHADYVHKWLKEHTTVQIYKVAPISGFFLDQKTIEGKPVYEEQMKNIWQMANSTGGVNDACVAYYKPTGDEWKCNFAPFTYPFIEAPIMALNSAYDAWQTKCILTSELAPGFPNQNSTGNGHCNAIPAYSKCQVNPDSCNQTQMETMGKLVDYFNLAMQSAVTYKKAGNGAFIHSCHTHGEAKTDDAFVNFTVRGVTIREAVHRWWTIDDAPADDNNYEPCHYKTGPTGPRDCNPSCL